MPAKPLAVLVARAAAASVEVGLRVCGAQVRLGDDVVARARARTRGRRRGRMDVALAAAAGCGPGVSERPGRGMGEEVPEPAWSGVPSRTMPASV